MNIFVAVRQTGILRGDPVLSSDQKSVDITSLKRHINEWDLYALEEALKIKAENGAHVTVVSVGDKKTEEAIYYCLAAGADKGVLIEVGDSKYLDSWQISFLLSRVISDNPYDLILSGVQSEDEGCAEVSAILACMLNISLSSTVIEIKSFSDDEGIIKVQNELEEGFYDVRQLKMPALISIQTGINQPRYVSSMRLRNTKKKSNIDKILAENILRDESGFASKKVPQKLVVSKTGSTKLEIIEGENPAEKANNLLERLYKKGVL